MKGVSGCLALLVAGVALGSLVGLAFGGMADESNAQTLARQVTVIVTLSIGLALMHRTTTFATDLRRCLIAWLLFVVLNVLLVLLLVLSGMPETIAERLEEIPSAAFRSIGWLPWVPPRVHDGAALVGFLVLSGVVIMWLSAKGADLLRRNFLR